MKNPNNNKQGYKETKVGWIPKGWGWEHLGKLAAVRASNVDKKRKPGERNVRLCNYTDVYYRETIDESEGYMEATASETQIAKFLLNKGDVIITKDSETPDDIAMPAYVERNFEDLVCGYHLCLIRPKDSRLDGAYLTKLFQIQVYRHYFYTLANGVTRYGLTKKSTTNAFIPLPPLPEQRKIAEILSCWDEGLEGLEKLIEAKKLRKKGLMQKLLTGEKRLPGFSMNWKKISLNQLMNESRISGTNGACAHKLTVKLHGKGVSEKIEKRSGSKTTKYFKRSAGQFIYSKLDFLNGAFGIIPVALDGYESTLDLPAFDLNKAIIDAVWLISFLTREEFYISYHALANGGRKARRINPKDFKHIQFLLPSLPEQRAIASILNTADEEIRLLEAERDALAEQKKGLMQKLLTGEVRHPDFAE